MKDDLGTRMKTQYEKRFRHYLPRRTYTILRVDGKAFHTYTRGCAKPFDTDLMNSMDHTAMEMCKNIQGAAFAYIQSDEISILLTDFNKITTDAWFDGNIQKMTSVGASMASTYFNQTRANPTAIFDARVFIIPDPIEVENYFIWRQKDAVRNSIQMLAQSMYSHKELHGKNSNMLQDLIHAKDLNWNDCDVREKRGRIVFKCKDTHEWSFDDPITFTQNRNYLNSLIPDINAT